MVDSSTPVWTRREGALAILGLKAEENHDDNQHVTQTEASLQRHLDAGKGIAYYCNEDLGHHMLGDVVALTFGTPEAQFEPEQFPDGPPKQMPDGLQRDRTGGINWRYQLCAVTYAFPDIVEHHDEVETVAPPSTQVWVAIDVAADGPDGMVIVQQVLQSNSRITGWRVINPASDEDAAQFEEIRDRLKTVFEEQGPMEELFPDEDEQDTGVPPESPAYQGKIGEHLIGRHRYSPEYVAVKLREGNQSDLVAQHSRMHEDPTAANLQHSHESLRPEDL